MNSSDCNKTIYACCWSEENGIFYRDGVKYDIRVQVTNRLGEAVHILRAISPVNIGKLWLEVTACWWSMAYWRYMMAFTYLLIWGAIDLPFITVLIIVKTTNSTCSYSAAQRRQKCKMFLHKYLLIWLLNLQEAMFRQWDLHAVWTWFLHNSPIMEWADWDDICWCYIATLPFDLAS